MPIALILYREARDKITPDSTAPDPFDAYLAADSTRVLRRTLRREQFRPKLLAVANAADDSDWRKSLRQALEADETDVLLELAADDQAHEQSPELIAWLGAALREAEEFDVAADVLQQSQQRHPGDFWLNYELSECLSRLGRPVEAVGFARAALAIRPHSTGAMWAVAAALDDAGKKDESLGLFQQMLSKSDMEAAEYVALASSLHNRGRLMPAEAAARKAIDLDPTDVEAHRNLGRALDSQDRHDEAVAALEKAVELDPENYYASFSLAYALAHADRDEEAIAAYRKTIEIDPNRSSPHNNLGLLLRSKGQLQEAADMYRRALRLDPKSIYAPSNLRSVLTELLSENGPSNELQAELAALRSREAEADKRAIDTYRASLEWAPRNVNYRYHLAKALHSDSQYEEAAQEFREVIRLDPEHASAHHRLGRSLAALGQLSEAIEHHRTAVKLSPDDRDYYFSLAAAAHSQALGGGRSGFISRTVRTANLELTESEAALLDEAIDAYKKCIELDESESKSNSRFSQLGLIAALHQRGRIEEADAAAEKWKDQLATRSPRERANAEMAELFDRVRELRAGGQVDEAIRQLQSFAQENPTETRVSIELGRLLVDQGRDQEAETLLRQIIDDNPISAGPYNAYIQLGRLLTENGRFDDAIAVYDQAIATGADSPTRTAGMYVGKGRVLRAAKRWDEALASYNKALELNPRLGTIHAGIGSLRVEQGDREGAIAAFRDGIAASPRSRSCNNALAWQLVIEPDENGQYPHVDEALEHAQIACRQGAAERGQRLFASYLNTLGVVYYRKGDWLAALKALQESFEGDAEVPTNWIFLAMTHWQLGNKDEALKWYEQARKQQQEIELTDVVKRFFDEAATLMKPE